MKKAFTLIEYLFVIVIMVIVAAFVLTNYDKAREVALKKEADGNLRRIQEAEKFYALKMGVFYPAAGSTTDITEINNNLKINLQAVAGSANWQYTINSSTACITAERTRADAWAHVTRYLGFNQTAAIDESSCH